ncbi:hypothetical protein [Mycolicibacterium conceptionense]|uniref:hypothetical protein n=1 Tax=Mycolicibacterium conceptionense TaxID=451644 RepID=UPI0007EB2127|nr:hypothetical protein [Mycolicibacterium conceptionense]OBB07554.1 hypothetical protein A5718_17065 [Mycolicibacterium conceptionense]OBF32056.1 hypothetical protein A5720_27630 [Mycolicibacterium conceptionense]
MGEVLAASDELQARELSPRAFHALVAIAEKAGVHDREASVRWDHIRAGLYGASKRTAERAVEELKAAGLISVVRPGFKNQHAAQAPVYRVLALVDHDTQVSVSKEEDHDTQVSVSGSVDTDKSELDTDKTASGYRHPGVVLDGSLDGSIDGARARLGDEPRCERHRDPVIFPRPPSCPDCRNVRKTREAEQRATAIREAAERDHRAAMRQQCPDCQGTNWITDDDGEPIKKCDHRRTA